MFHTILIPHRDRNAHLEWCLWSIERSAQATGIYDFQVIIVDAESEFEPEPPVRGMVVHDQNHGHLFSKARCYNVGMALSCLAGGIVTFLDADAIVGRRWLEAARCLAANSLTRLCYRVWLLPVTELDGITASNRELAATDWFAKCERTYVPAGEFYGNTDDIYTGPDPPPPFGPHVFGNSQCTMRWDTLGDLEYHEGFVGRGREDQWFAREVWRRAGDAYCGALMTHPDFAMLHISDPRPMTEDDGWNNLAANESNKRLYEET